MKKLLILLLIIFTSMLFTAGCTEKTQDNSTNSQNNQTSAVIEATQLEQINESLQKGPVLVKIGAEWCEECQEMKPVLAQLAAEYGDKISVITVDMEKSPEIANYFGIYVIPDSFVIVRIENGEYVYMQEDGRVNTDRSKARILKFKKKETFEKILDLALQEEKAKSG
jgi:thioredoxin 1